MTERGRNDVSRSNTSLSIGPSSVQWENGALKLDIDEWTAPLPSRLRGTVLLHPSALNAEAFGLDAQQRHFWRPIAPQARIEVCFDEGRLNWSGAAYLDSNWGNEPLEHRFSGWSWSRAHAGPDTFIYYDVSPRAEAAPSLALRFDASAAATRIEAPPWSNLPQTFWRVPRAARGATRLVRTLEDAPFYARSQLAGSIHGRDADIMHETVSLDRFRTPIVRAMLPFRMPRIVARR